jgi:putative ABC transport system permease protein
VVGIVGTVKWIGLEAPDPGTVYFPFVDLPNAFVVLRTSGAPGTQATALQQAIRELDPALAVTRVTTGDDLVSTSIAAPRYLSVLVGGFALAALVLSVVGIYGVMAYFIQQHRREIGIRLALGGEPSDVRRMVVLQGLRLVAIGVGLGIGGAFLTSRSLPAVLFGVSPTDVPTMVCVPLALLTIAALACLAPGRRAGRLDPAEVLREG